MDLQRVVAHCRGKAGTTAERPFGPDVLVMKVAGKVFAIVADHEEPPSVSVKCEPDVAVALRDAYEAVRPGYHLNKRHWNTVTLDGSVPSDQIRDWLDDSYDLVVAGLPRALRTAL